MEKKCTLSSGTGFFLGMLCLGIFILLSVTRFKSYDRTVNVKGLCEMEVKADKAIYPIAFRESGNVLEQVYGSVNDKNSKIIEFLKSYGFTDEEISIGIPRVSDRDAEGYTQRAMRFVVTSVVTLYTSKVDKVIEMSTRLSELNRQGITLANDDWTYRPNYLFEGLNEIKPQMIEDATANAREAAQKFANDSGSRLGKIKNATQGQFSISDRDENTPYFKKVRVVTNVTYYLKR